MKRLVTSLVVFVMLITSMQGLCVFAEDGIYPGDIRWDFTSGTDGWEVYEKTRIIGAKDGALQLIGTDSGGSPRAIKYVCNIDLTPYNYMRIRAKNNTNYGEVIAYFQDPSDNKWVQASCTRDKKADTDYVDYVLDVSGISGTKKLIRFDYMYIGNNLDNILYYLDSIVLSKNQTPLDTQLVSKVKVDGTELSGFNPSKEEQTLTLDRNTFRKINNKGNVTVELPSDSTNTTAVSVTNAVDYETGKFNKYIDIDVKDASGSVIRDYRIICLSDQSVAENNKQSDIVWDANVIQNFTTDNATKGDIKNNILPVSSDGQAVYAGLKTNNDFSTSDYNYIKVRVKQNSNAVKQMKLHMAVAAGLADLVEQAFTVDTSAVGNFKEYIVPIDMFNIVKTDFVQNVNWMRFDFVDDKKGTYSADIDYIMLSQKAQQDVSVNTTQEYKDNNLTVTATVQNNTESNITVQCLGALYDKDGILKDVAIQNLPSDSDLAKTEGDRHPITAIYPMIKKNAALTFENYTYTEGDIVKVYVFDSFTGIKPMMRSVLCPVNEIVQ